jgi:hypothetical protein
VPIDWIIQGGATGLLAAVFGMIVTGRLVPRSTLLDVREQRDKWERAANTLMQQNNQLLTGARVATDVIRALPDAAAGERA